MQPLDLPRPCEICFLCAETVNLVGGICLGLCSAIACCDEKLFSRVFPTHIQKLTNDTTESYPRLCQASQGSTSDEAEAGCLMRYDLQCRKVTIVTCRNGYVTDWNG